MANDCLNPRPAKSITEELAEFIGTNDRATRQTLNSVGLRKGEKKLRDLLFELQSRKRQGELAGIRNLAAYVVSKIKDLPDVL